MRYYTAYLPRALTSGPVVEGDAAVGADEVLGGAVFVREGFNWLAFWFSVPWAVANGLWLTALAMAASLALIVGLPAIFAPDWYIRAVLLVGYALICGFSGNDLRRLGLVNGGWELIAVVAANDRAHAFLRFAYLQDECDASDDVRSASSLPPRPALPKAPRLDIGPNPGFWS